MEKIYEVGSIEEKISKLEAEESGLDYEFEGADNGEE